MSDTIPKQDIVFNADGTATWVIDQIGEIGGTYRGTFVFRCWLSPTQTMAAGREYRDLIGSHPELATESERFSAFSLTQLKYRVIKSPPFWTATLQASAYAGDIPDKDIISVVLDASVEAEIRYREVLKKKKDDTLEKVKKAAEEAMAKRDEALKEEVDDEGKIKKSTSKP